MHPKAPPESRMLTCQGESSCVVTVNVACTHFFGCDLSVDYDLVLVRGRGKATNIAWRLGGDASAQFAANGIVVNDPEMQCAAKSETREFQCTDRHRDFGVFKYRVNVTVPQSAFGPRGVPSLDPWIVND
jgi:hypothetical protein